MSTLVEKPHCWKSHVGAQISVALLFLIKLSGKTECRLPPTASMWYQNLKHLLEYDLGYNGDKSMAL